MYMSKGLGRYNNKNQLFDKHQHKKILHTGNAMDLVWHTDVILAN